MYNELYEYKGVEANYYYFVIHCSGGAIFSPPRFHWMLTNVSCIGRLKHEKSWLAVSMRDLIITI